MAGQETRGMIRPIRLVTSNKKVKGMIIHNLVFSKIEVISNTPTIPGHLPTNIREKVGNINIRHFLLKLDKTGEQLYVPVLEVKADCNKNTHHYSLGETFFNNPFDAAMEFNPIVWKRNYDKEISDYFDRHFS